jgi:hypothetical protein
MGRDDQTIGLIHKFTYNLETDEDERDDQTIGLPSIHKFTYFLETDEEDGTG